MFPQAQIQTYFVHIIRNSLNYVGWKDRKALAAELKTIYQATSAEAAEATPSAFESGVFGQRCPPIAQAWRRKWTEVIPFFDYLPDVLRIIYTTNAIESLQCNCVRPSRTEGTSPVT